MLWKCWTQYASNFGKLSSGHKIGKGQCSFHVYTYLCAVCIHTYNTEQQAHMCVYIQHANMCICVCSVQFSHSVMSHSLRPHGLQHVRLPCPVPSPRAFSNSCPLHRWCHPTITISSSVVPFSSRLQSFTESESFLMSQLFTSGGQSTGDSASASVLLMYIQGWFPLGWIDLISLQSKGLSRVFSNTTVQKHQFFGFQPSLWSNSHIHTWLLEKS